MIRTIAAGRARARRRRRGQGEGELIGGIVFDNSIKRGQPEEFPLNGVVLDGSAAENEEGEKSQVWGSDRGSLVRLPSKKRRNCA